MEKETRHYQVGGLTFSVELELPWTFMNYTGQVCERICRAASGETVKIMPTRAGDKVPHRTYVTAKEELPDNFSAEVLDFSQYEPFHSEKGDDSVFRMKVVASGFEEYACIPRKAAATLIREIKDNLPHFSIYEYSGEEIFVFSSAGDEPTAVLSLSDSGREGEFRVKPGTHGYGVMFQVSTALMIQYTYVSSFHSALLIHASVIGHDGMANMFLGESGTGKSTHSHLWLEHISGSELVNDDNPVLRMENGILFVYGSPWSGKTPCYVNRKVQVRALVHLVQAPSNSIGRLKGVELFSIIFTSVSNILWNDSVEEHIADTITSAASIVPGWRLRCLPDADAVLVCRSAIEEK